MDKSNKAADTKTGPLFAGLMLSNNEQIQAVLQRVKDAMPTQEGIQWEPAPLWHITLIYALSGVSDEAVYYMAETAEFGEIPIRATRLGHFDNNGQRVLYITVDKTPELTALQTQLYHNLIAQGVDDISPFSEPFKWQPHITLAYMPVGTDIPNIGGFALETKPFRVMWSRADYYPMADSYPQNTESSVRFEDGKGKQMKHAQEHKAFPAVVLSTDDEQGIVEAVVAVNGNIDDGLDRIKSGAFRKTIRERVGRIRVLNNHQSGAIEHVVGKPLEMRELSRAELVSLAPQILEEYPDAQGGLYTKTQYLIDTPEGLGVYRRIKANAVNEYSIGYDAMDITYTKENRNGQSVSIRNIGTIRLWEYSPVIWGMNPATVTVGVKSDIQASETQAEEAPEEAKGILAAPNFGASVSAASCEHCRFMAYRNGLMVCEAFDFVTAPLAVCDSFEVQEMMISDDMLELMGNLNTELEDKAGRTISAANMERIKRMHEAMKESLSTIEELMRVGGAMEEVAEESEEMGAAGEMDGKSTEAPQPESTGPDETPPMPEDEIAEKKRRALAQLEIERLRLEYSLQA